jgi:hypothetical protein
MVERAVEKASGASRERDFDAICWRPELAKLAKDSAWGVALSPGFHSQKGFQLI